MSATAHSKAQPSSRCILVSRIIHSQTPRVRRARLRHRERYVYIVFRREIGVLLANSLISAVSCRVKLINLEGTTVAGYAAVCSMAQTTARTNAPDAPGPTGRIRRAHLAMQRCADALFSPRKVTTDQYALLWVVLRREGIRQNELATELFTDANTVTAMVVRLETRGLIRREVCSDDARARRIHLTPSGRRLVTRLSEDWEPMRRKLRDIFAGDAGEEAL